MAPVLTLDLRVSRLVTVRRLEDHWLHNKPVKGAPNIHVQKAVPLLEIRRAPLTGLPHCEEM